MSTTPAPRQSHSALSEKMSSVSGNLDRFIEGQFPDYIRQAMMRACSIVQESAVSKAPKDTGALARSIDLDVSEDGGEGVVFSNLEYAPYVEIGTGTHSSKGTGRKDKWRYRGRYGWVTTDGNEPQPFLEPALLDNRQNINQCFEGLF